MDDPRPLKINFISDQDDGGLAAVGEADSPEVAEDVLGQVEAAPVYHWVHDHHAVGVVRRKSVLNLKQENIASENLRRLDFAKKEWKVFLIWNKSIFFTSKGS